MDLKKIIVRLRLSSNIEKALIWIIDYIDTVLASLSVDELTEDLVFDEFIEVNWVDTETLFSQIKLTEPNAEDSLITLELIGVNVSNIDYSVFRIKGLLNTNLSSLNELAINRIDVNKFSLPKELITDVIIYDNGVYLLQANELILENYEPTTVTKVKYSLIKNQ